MATTSLHHPEFQKVLTCVLCGSGRESWQLCAEAYGAVPYEKELFSIYRCGRCGLGITEPVPSEADSHLLYEDRTSNDFQGDDSAVAAMFKRATADRDMRAFAGDAMRSRRGGKMLDYACGNGNFALSMRRVFPESVVFAADYHTEAPAMLKGSGVHYTDYSRLAESGPFDFILCRHVLEHTYRPVEFLRTMGNLLSSGGVLMIESPNLQAPLRRVFGRHWDNYYVPFHPIHLTRASLQQAALDAELVVAKEGGGEMPKVGRSLQNMMHCRYNFALFGAGVLLQPLQVTAGLVSREPTCLRLWARKP